MYASRSMGSARGRSFSEDGARFGMLFSTAISTETPSSERGIAFETSLALFDVGRFPGDSFPSADA